MQKPGKNHSMASGLEAERSQNLELSLIPKWKHLESRSIWQAREGQIEQLETGAEEKQARERSRRDTYITCTLAPHLRCKGLQSPLTSCIDQGYKPILGEG